MLGLPDGITACLFDLDGVLTNTAAVHARAWKAAFDAFLPTGSFEDADYNAYVDGKSRETGVRDFLASREIAPTDAQVAQIAASKDELFVQLIHSDGVTAYPGSVAYLHAVRDAGLRRAVVSSSHHCAEVVRAAGIADLLEARVDGHVIDELHLPGKPAPDAFLEGARRLGKPPAECVVFEDALAGVEAGRAGKFGHVVGVDRVGQGVLLREHGADTVVKDLAELA